jgi:hypothetical protein
MKAKYKVALAMVGSFALGAIAVQTLHAQAKPPGFIIAEVGVADPEGFSKEFLPRIWWCVATSRPCPAQKATLV